MTTTLTPRQYAEQRKWDSWDDDEESKSMPREQVLRNEGAFRAYSDMVAFLDGSYRPEYIEAVADRAERRRLYGPHREY